MGGCTPLVDTVYQTPATVTSSDVYDGAAESPLGVWAPNFGGGAGYGQKITFSSTTVPAYSYNNKVGYASFANIYEGAAGQYHADQHWWANTPLTWGLHWAGRASDGIASFEARVVNLYAYNQYGISAGLAANVDGFLSTTFSSTSAAYTNGTNEGYSPTLAIIPTAGTTNTNKVLRVIGGYAKKTTGTGFMPYFMSIGGYGAEEWQDTAKWSQAAMNAWVSFSGIDTVYLFIGQNDSSVTKAQYKAWMNTIIDRFRTANPNMQFVLCSMYQSDPATYWTTDANRTPESFADALYEITLDRADYCLFLNVWAATKYGSTSPTINYNFLRKNYLSDDIHPSDSNGGRPWLMGVVESLKRQAARQYLFDRRPGRRIPNATERAEMAG